MANPGRRPDVTPSRSSTVSSTPGSPPRRVKRNGSTASNPPRSSALNGRYSHAPQSSSESAAFYTSPDGMHSRHNSLTIPRHDGNGSESNYGSSSGDDDDDDDALLAELNEDDIPVTGFAVASNKRNADFHDLFSTVPEGDYLIEDYGCALQREILIQGRIYISENHICFHANIFGWITDLIIPIYDIQSLDKKMTAFVIPNAIQMTTRNAKYTFASFLARDTVYDVIYNIWRLARPEDGLSEDDGRAAEPSIGSQVVPPQLTQTSSTGSAVPLRKATQCACGRDGKHLNETAMQAVYPGTPERIYNLMFASGFIKDFMRVDQKLDDIQISDWAPSADTKNLARNMSYIKPLTGSIGPRQTKCELRDETIYSDFDDHIITLTTTRTPDVPSGGVFAVKTRTCIMWASAVSTKVIVTTQVDWTGRSFIKGIIEKSAIEGQKTYHADLDKAMRAYIQQHQTEFIPAGVDPAVVAAVEPVAAPIAPADPSKAEPFNENAARKSREHERNQRGLQWAYDTFDGALSVATNSASTAIDLVSDAWDQSSTSTILYFAIAMLVISNVWTLMLVGRREEAGRRKEMRKTEERERWVQGIVTALWDELSAGRGAVGPPPVVQLPPAHPGEDSTTRPTSDWQAEVAEIGRALDAVEQRVRVLRGALKELD
ncbi:GRAM-domain-containing protein [Auriscalpium vulgare]|uniref:GRAM-domain-containing protein n=1 Tax=Auriscalpium vulgare TaxID=40419 RepID=A0ACB8REL3_9AGAM|nr:GRAM-domain-containing protein [Auriscalpium vulgare]